MVKTFPFFFFLYHQKCFLSIFSSLRNERKIFSLCHIFYHVLGAFFYFYNNKNWTGKNNSNIFGFLRYSMASIFFLMLLVYKKFSKDDIKMFALLGLISISIPVAMQNIGLKFLGLISISIPVAMQNIGLKFTSAYISGFLQSTKALVHYIH